MAIRSTRWRTAGGVLLVLAVAFYAPLSLTYFWNGPDGPNLQDNVFKILLTPAFAFGFGSGHDRIVGINGSDPHFHTFAKTYVNMWIHSTVGTTALIAGLSQFSETLRRRNMAIHRALGKVFILCCLAVAATAAYYLTVTPGDDVFSGRGFQEVLWTLASGTAALALLAFVSIRRRDLIAHREFATGAFALICSAGLLRLQWMGMETFWSPGKEMLNLVAIESAAMILMTGAMLYVSRFWKGTRGADSPLVTPLALRVAVGAGVVGIAVIAYAATRVGWSSQQPAWFAKGWGPIVLGGFIPWAVHMLWLGAMTLRAKKAGNVAAHAAWRTYLVGGVAGPAFGALGLGFAVFVHRMPIEQAFYLVSFMWGVGLVLAYAAHASLTTRWAKRSARTVEVLVDSQPLQTI